MSATSEQAVADGGAIKQSVLEAIGDTPLVRLRRVAAGAPYRLLAKLEMVNPSGSAKDRSALFMLEEAERSGRLEPGATVIEASSGNTGIALAMAAAVKGYRVVCVTTDRQSPEKIGCLKAYGAEVVVCPSAVRPEDPRSHHSVAWRLAEEIPGSCFLHQHANPDAAKAYERGLAEELWEQTAGRITHVFCGLGTGALASGIAHALAGRDERIAVIGVQPAGSIYADARAGLHVPPDRVGAHLTEGIGEAMLPSVCDLGALADVVSVEDRDAMLMTRRLARSEGILAGPSSGAVVAGALSWCRAHEIGPEATVVCVLHDAGSRYLSKVFNDEWMKANRFFEERMAQTAAELAAFKRAEAGSIPALISVSPHSLLLEVLELFRHHEVSQLPVIDAGGVVGSVREERVVHLLVRDPEAKNRPASEVMEAPFPVLDPSASIEEISDLLREWPAVLVDTEGGLDILTKADLIRAIARWST